LPQPTVVREVESGSLVAIPLAGDELIRHWEFSIAAARI